MSRKKANKKPPTGQGEGGVKGENERGRNVFYAYCKTKPAKKQIDYAKQADVFRQQANYFSIMAEIADNMSKAAALQEQANLSLMPIYAGGTVYQIPGGADED